MKEISNRRAFLNSSGLTHDDRILPETRWLAALIIPFLVVAFIILYFWPNDTDKLFAWTIKPTMTPMMLAAAYFGGIYFFTRAILAKQWHLVKVGFLPVTAFASLLGIATILHWDRFNHSHISFYTWAALYFTTPFLVFAVWLRNRTTDPGTAESRDTSVHSCYRCDYACREPASLSTANSHDTSLALDVESPYRSCRGSNVCTSCRGRIRNSTREAMERRTD